MIIRIMRHGDAPFINGERQISEMGNQEIDLVGAWLKQQYQPEMILVSPILRAQQTWQRIQPFVDSQVNVSEENLLKPESNALIATQYFEALESSSLLLISHMPLVTNLLQAWLPGQGRYFPTAAIAELKFEGGKVFLNNFISPSDL